MTDTPQQDLSQLEMAFAADPKAFVPLTNAYLQLGRLMEAMVVCKKGIKALPDSVEGRLLLGRVYAEQGKVPKAIEEAKGVLGSNPEHADAHFFLGTMLEKSGRFEEAIESFKETLRKDRKHSDAKAALKAKGIDFDPGPSPEEIAAAKAAEEARLAAERAAAEAKAAEEARLVREAEEKAAAERAAVEAAALRAQQAKAHAISAAMMGGSSTPPRTTGSIPVSSVGGGGVASLSPQPVDPAFAAAYAQNLYGYPGPQAQQGKKSLGLGFTFGLFALLLLVMAGIVGGLVMHRKNQDEVLALLKDVQVLVKKDTTRNHKKALDKLEAALKIDDGNDYAVGQYAYSLNVLADRGVKDVEANVGPATERAKKVAGEHPLSVAARMIHARMAGNAAEAESLAKVIGPDPRALPVPVRVELGRALAAQGRIADMISLADTLKDLPDANAASFAGEAYRRNGDVFKARAALDVAIKTDLDHDPGRALRALLILEQDDVVNLPVALDDVTTLLDLGKDAVGNRQRGYATLGRALIGQRVRTSDKETGRDIEAARLLLRNDPEMPLFEAQQAKNEKRWDDAIKLAGDAIKLDPYRLAPYLALIEIGARAKKFDVADKAYNDARTAFADNLELGLARGQRLNAEDKTDEALGHLKGMLEKLDLAEVHRDIGKVYMKKQDWPKAVESLKKAAEKASTRGPGIQANVYTWLGRALAKAEDHAQAKEAYAQALSATSEFPSTYYWLGVTLQVLEENDAAREAFTKYVRAEPQGAYVEDAKKRLSE